MATKDPKGGAAARRIAAKGERLLPTYKRKREQEQRKKSVRIRKRAR